MGQGAVENSEGTLPSGDKELSTPNADGNASLHREATFQDFLV